MNIVLRPGEIVFEDNTFPRTFYFSDLSGFNVVLPFQLSICYQVPIFHCHTIMWVLPFCQIGLVDNLSKDFKTSYIAFVPL